MKVLIDDVLLQATIDLLEAHDADESCSWCRSNVQT